MASNALFKGKIGGRVAAKSKHIFFRFKHFGHKSLVQIKVLLRVVDEKLVEK